MYVYDMHFLFSFYLEFSFMLNIKLLDCESLLSSEQPQILLLALAAKKRCCHKSYFMRNIKSIQSFTKFTSQYFTLTVAFLSSTKKRRGLDFFTAQYKKTFYFLHLQKFLQFNNYRKMFPLYQKMLTFIQVKMKNRSYSLRY